MSTDLYRVSSAVESLERRVAELEKQRLQQLKEKAEHDRRVTNAIWIVTIVLLWSVTIVLWTVEITLAVVEK